jgi:hypothetical protein
VIRIVTDAYEARHGSKPRGSRYWVFTATGATTGRRKAKTLQWTLETDGPWREARDQALESARAAFGTTADINVEVRP